MNKSNLIIIALAVIVIILNMYDGHRMNQVKQENQNDLMRKSFQLGWLMRDQRVKAPTIQKNWSLDSLYYEYRILK